MCSIAEDQSLPVDFNGTSLQLSSPMDSTMHDPTSPAGSDVETPEGMFPTLNSIGGISPHRVRTMKDQEQQLAELRKNNFGLKLRIYHLEEALTKKWGERSEGWQLNIDLQVQMDNLKKELEEKDALLLQAKGGLSAMAAKHAQELNALRQSVSAANNVCELEERLGEREAELADAQQQTAEANARADEMQQESEQLEEEVRQKERDMEDLQRELDNARQELADQRTVAKVPPVSTHNMKVQTTEPVVGRTEAEGMKTQLADTAARLQEAERVVLELRGEVADKAGRVKELEVELLTASQNLAAGAGVHAHQMSEQAEQLDRCKAKLRDAEAELRRQGVELGERERECREREREAEDAWQRAREAEQRANSLEPRTKAAEREAMDLRRQLREAQAQEEEDAANRAREMRDMEQRLREAEKRLGRSQPEMASKQREVEDMARILREKDEEISQLKSQLGAREEEVSRARRAAHSANMERQEQARALGELRGELGGLRDQLQQKQASVQQSTDAALAAKDGIINQLQRELQDLRAKLADADDRLLHLTTSKAAELGVLHGTVDDLTQQIEQLEGQLRALRKEMGEMVGEKAALEREMAKLRAQNAGLQEQLAAVTAELEAKNDQLQAAHRAIDDLQRLVEDLQRGQPSKEHLEKEAAEKAQLKSQLASLRAALAHKEGEARRLGQALELKDGTISDLQQRLRAAEEEREGEAERAEELQREKCELQNEVAGLQSQGRIAQLSADDLQARLTDAYREREELARKLRQAEEALGNKDTAYERARKACEALQRQVVQLQDQVRKLSQRADTTSVGVATSSPGRQDSGVMAGGVDESVGTSPPQHQGGATGPSSTTMIFGSLSEDLLKTILQLLQEVYSEVLTNRTTGSVASSTLASKMEHLTDLQRHLEACFHDSKSNAADSKPASGNTSYTAYYFMRGEDGEPMVNEEDNEEGGRGGRTPPRKSSTPKKRSPKSPPKVSEHFVREETLGSVPPREAQAQIGALQSELEEVKRWNEALQTRLKESGGTRDVGVGMEKGATVTPSQSASFAREKYLELEAEVDRLLGELEAEKERSQADREHQETECAALHGELSAARERVGELEQQLREAVMRDTGTSTEETEAVNALGEKAELLEGRLGEAGTTIARLRGKLQAEKDDNHQLREEVKELRRERIQRAPGPTTAERGTSVGATASMPNLLLTPDRTPGKRTADSWTSPGVGVGGTQGDRLDMRALKRRQEEVTRLNQELQRKCQEQLHRSPPSATTAATSTSTSWQGKPQREETSVERERSLLAQLRQCEAREAEREVEWRERERELLRQVAELEGRLGQCNHDCEAIRAKLTESLAACRDKDEERINVTRSLSQSSERVRDLELQLQQLQAKKNSAIRQLEEQQAVRERELHSVQQRAEELAEVVERLESERREEEEGEEEEVETLRESVESLTQQLTSALEDLERLQRQNTAIEEQRNILHSQLSSCQEQVSALQAELRLYHKLVQESTKSLAASGTASSGRLLQLLEEVRRLREQLHQGVRNSDALAEQLRSKLDVQRQVSEEEEIDEGDGEGDGESSSSESQDEGEMTQRSKVTQTTQWSRSRPSETQPRTSTAAEPGFTTAFPHLTTSVPEARIPLGGIGTLTVKADVQMTGDGSATSLPQFSHSTTKLPHRGGASFVLSAPRSQSSPFVRGVGLQHTSHAPSSSERGGEEVKANLFGTRATGGGINPSSHIRGQKGHKDDSGHRLTDYLSREGIPKLEPTLTSRHSRQSSAASLSSHPPHPTPGTGARGAVSSTTTQTSAPHTHSSPHAALGAVGGGGGGGSGEFENLESRLKRALESSTLQGADRTFLEELLGYLCQQRRQLDESWRLIENMEQQKQQEVGGASRVAVETSQSGTIPSSSATRQERGKRRGGRTGTSGVDLPSLYEHILKTQASLIEAKTNLSSHQKHT